MTILILHGIASFAGWQQWLYDQLVDDGHEVIMPELPKIEKPDRGQWLFEVQKLLHHVNHDKLIIVGHSLGIITAFDYLETEKKKIHGVISVSGFVDDYGADLNSYFISEKNIDLEKIRDYVDNAFVIYGDDDPYVPQENLQKIAKDLNVRAIVVEEGGHLSTDAGFTEFPVLLEMIKQIT